jgi:hypothetical protein
MAAPRSPAGPAAASIAEQLATADLLTDGRRIYVENSAQQVIDILKNARQPMFAVCLSDTVRRVHPKLRKSASSARGGGGMQSRKRVASKLRA